MLHWKRFLLLATLTGMMAAPAWAQEWTAQQLEVWKNVQTYSALARDGNIEEFIQYFHKDFSGWVNGSPLPDNYEQRAALIRNYFPKSKTVFSQIKPVSIKVHGNFAIVHYYFAGESQEGEDGEAVFTSGRWTDILMKQGDKWVMIGDHGGPDSSEDD